MKRRTRWIAGLSAAVVLLTGAVPASAYTGQVEGIVTVAVRGTVACAAPATLTATIVDASGAPIEGASVDWSFVTKQSASDKITKTPTLTNAKGVATTKVTLAAVSGPRRIRATSGNVSAAAVIDQSCGGLPNTSTLPGETAPQGSPVGILLIVTLVAAVSGGLTLRRLATTSR